MRLSTRKRSPNDDAGHSGNAVARREDNARSNVCDLLRLPERCSPNNRTNDSGNTIQWRQIIDMFSYATSKKVFPEQSDDRFGEHDRMASR